MATKSMFLLPVMATTAYYTYKKAIEDSKAVCEPANKT